MKYTKAMRTAQFYDRFASLGFSYEETETLRRAQMTLSRWGELECGNSNDHASWAIERDETTGKPFLVTHPHQSGAKTRRRPVADREKGALKRVSKLMEAHPEFIAYHQGDPRGCSLYIVRKTDVPEGKTVDAYYTRGFACCL